MGFLTKIISSGVGDLVSDVSSSIDKLSTSKEEKLQAVQNIKADLYNFTTKMNDSVTAAESELTARLQSDNMGSWMSRNIRPISFVASYLLCFYLIIFKPGMRDALDLIRDILEVQIAFYFSSRGIEKSIKLLKATSSLSDNADGVLDKSKGVIGQWFDDRKAKKLERNK